MADRYSRNRELISEGEQALISKKTVAIVGLGGLGGHVAEQLARLGFGRLILVDGDSVDPTNLNRQLFATEDTVGMPKVQAAMKRLAEVNPEVTCMVWQTRLTAENGPELLKGADLVIDAVDSIPTRFVIENICEGLNLPLVHGSIGGWWGQVSVIFPADKAMRRIYPREDARGAEAKYGNPAFTPAVVASIQVAEALKICLGKPQTLRGKLLILDLLEQEYMIIDI